MAARARSSPTRSSSRHVPAAVKREVWRRDGGQCAFIGAAGRCTERGFLEYHHRVPFADGGAATSENLELRCRGHNAYEAERWFGFGVVRETAPAFIACASALVGRSPEPHTELLSVSAANPTACSSVTPAGVCPAEDTNVRRGDALRHVDRHPQVAIALVADRVLNLAGRWDSCTRSTRKAVLDPEPRSDAVLSQWLRRDRCFSEIERMISLPLPLAGRAVLACATAAATSASTS